MTRTIALITLAASLAVAQPVAAAGGGGMALLDARTDLDNRASLQRGAKLFVNYCLSCHGLEFMRYNRMGRDLGLTDEQVKENLMLAGEKVVDKMTVAMRTEDAKRWFGVAPPDLSVIARSRGADWLYSYLVTFYKDDSPGRPFGVNNVVFPDVGMPHVLWSLQGVPEYQAGEVPEGATGVHPVSLEASGDVVSVIKAGTGPDGEHLRIVDTLTVGTAGSLSPGEFRGAARDLVNFLYYAGEPAKMVRGKIGIWVLLFIGLLFVVSRALKKEYWKDVH